MIKRLVLGLLFATVGVAALIVAGGGLGSNRSPESTPTIDVVQPGPMSGGSAIALQAEGNLPLRTSGGEGVTVQSATETLVFEDPESGARREILGWFTWRFRCARFEPLPATGGGRQGVRCDRVVLELYRPPRTLAEADARLAGHLEAVLHQRVRADEAIAIGSLARELERTEGRVDSPMSSRNVVHLAGRVELEDLEQWIQVHGDQLTVHPNQGRVEGRGPFRIDHEALSLTGEGLEIDRADNGWSRVRILHRPRLTIHGDLKDKEGRAVFGFGDGEMRPTTIVADHEALLVREAARSETRLRVQFPRGVRAEQTGGRFLEAGWLELLAVRDGPPEADSRGVGGRWALRELHADRGVTVDYQDATADGRTYLARLEAKELLHLVPPTGAARTELAGQPRITVRGALSLGALARDGDRILATATERAWIEPVAAALVDPGHAPHAMRRIVLDGAARLARQNPTLGVREDTLAADRIEFLVYESPADEDGPSRTSVTTLVADGDVRIGSPWIEGTTPRFVAEALDTERPRIHAIGAGTVVTLPLLREDQGLLGSEGREGTTEGGAEGETAGRWTVRRLFARNEVEIQTSIGGASVGVPTWVTAREAIYEAHLASARLVGAPGAPARIRSRVAPEQDHEIEAQSFSMNPATGRITARDGVRGVIWLADGDAQGWFGAPREVRPARSLTIRTDTRIDVALVRDPESQRLDESGEQSVRIDGEVIAELRSDSLVVDRLKAGSLEVVLASEAKVERDAGTATPLARVFEPPATTGERRRAGGVASAVSAAQRLRVLVAAGDVEVQLTNGDVAWLEATGGVDLSGEMGRVTGERLRYTGALRRVEVSAGPQREAGAWLGDGEARTEIEATRLGLVWEDGEAKRAEASAAEGKTARIRLFRRDAQRPGRLERYVIQYRGSIVLLPERLNAEHVVVERTVRDGTDGSESPPATLMARTLEVLGRNLLSREPVEVDRMIASGPDTFFEAGARDAPVRIWGTRFDFDVPRAQATLTGTPPRGVTVQKASELASDHERVVIDLRDGLPIFLDGSRILWRPQDQR